MNELAKAIYAVAEAIKTSSVNVCKALKGHDEVLCAIRKENALIVAALGGIHDEQQKFSASMKTEDGHNIADAIDGIGDCVYEAAYTLPETYAKLEARQEENAREAERKKWNALKGLPWKEYDSGLKKDKKMG